MKSCQLFICCVCLLFIPMISSQLTGFGSLQDFERANEDETTTGGCRILQPPRHGEIECSEDNKVCHVTCHAWASMHGGSPILLCDGESGKWSSELPYCHPDFASCSPSYKCPPLRQEDLDSFRIASGITEAHQDEELIRLEQELIDRIRSKRSASSVGATRKKSLNCHEAFCTKPCAAFPKLRYANLCRMCKRRKFCYNIGYSLF